MGLGIFFFYLIRGLKTRINALEGTIKIQNQTLEVMERRIEETEKVGAIYKNLIADLPADIDNYKTILSKTKDEVILELQNQNEVTKKKLKEAQQRIEESGTSREVIEKHLRILKNLLSKPKDRYGLDKEYDLRFISEFNGRAIENSVSIILESKTLEEYLNKAGFIVYVEEKDEVSEMIFKERKTPDGEEIRTEARSVQTVNAGWFAVANYKIWLNEIRLNRFREEFNDIKTFA